MASWTRPWRLPMWMVVLHSALLQVRGEEELQVFLCFLSSPKVCDWR